MLSISLIKNSRQAQDYYDPVGYYQDTDVLAQDTMWFGQGCASLGLAGTVGMNQFKNILDGKVANSHLGRFRDGEKKHQCGWDLTFSAPKSLSILALIGKDSRLIDAHSSAVKIALGVLEQEFTKTRIRVSRESVVSVSTKSLVSALFPHSVSRDDDPQLHTHCVAANATLRSDGKWRCLESMNFFDHKMLVGQIYRNELALLVKNLGYQIDVNHQSGLFEIAGIPKRVIEGFSKRRETIESVAESPDAKEMARATLITRVRKKKISAQQLEIQWSKECKSFSFGLSKIKALVKKAIEPTWHGVSDMLCGKKSAQHAIDHLSKNEAVFSSRQLFEKTLRFGLGEIDHAVASKGIEEQKEIKSIVPSSLVVRGRIAESYTTPRALDREKYIITLLKQGKLAKNKINHYKRVDRYLKESNLSQGQQKAVRLILTSRDQFIGIQGFAGVGKTTMLRNTVSLIERTGYKMIACAPTHSAVSSLHAETGIESRTLANFLLSMERKKSSNCSKEIWIVDEASMIGAKDMANLMTYARSMKSRVVLLGDKLQLGSINWGNPFQLMMKNGMQTAVMKQIQRQKNERLKAAVEATIEANNRDIYKELFGITNALKKQVDIAKSNLTSAVAHLSSDVVEISQQEKLKQMFVNHYRNLSVQEKNNTLVIIPDHKTRNELMPFLRKAALDDLAKDGSISLKEKPLDTTVFFELDCSDKTLAQSYCCSEVVEFVKSYKKIGIYAGDKFRILKVNAKDNVVTLSPLNINHKTITIEWNPEKIAGKNDRAIRLLREVKRSFVVGEKIVFNKTEKELGLQNGTIATIEKIDTINHELTVKISDKKKLTFNYERFSQFDHGYATTVYKAQGKTADNMIFLAESYREKLITQKSFYVALSRARCSAKIFTDNKEQLIKKLSQRPDNKSSALMQQEMQNAINKVLSEHRKKINIPIRDKSICL